MYSPSVPPCGNKMPHHRYNSTVACHSRQNGWHHVWDPVWDGYTESHSDLSTASWPACGTCERRWPRVFASPPLLDLVFLRICRHPQLGMDTHFSSLGILMCSLELCHWSSDWPTALWPLQRPRSSKGYPSVRVAIDGLCKTTWTGSGLFLFGEPWWTGAACAQAHLYQVARIKVTLMAWRSALVCLQDIYDLL